MIKELMKSVAELKFLKLIASVDPAFARAIELWIYIAASTVVYNLISWNSITFEMIAWMSLAPILAYFAKRKRDAEKEIEKFKKDIEQI